MRSALLKCGYKIIAPVAAFILVMVLVRQSGDILRLQFGDTQYRSIQEEDWHDVERMPFYLDPGPIDTFEVQTTVLLSRIHPTVIGFQADDCLTYLKVNEYQVPDQWSWSYCDPRAWRDIDLSLFLHPGVNTIIAHVRNTGWPTALWIDVASSDPLRVLLVTIMLMSSGILGALICTMFFVRSRSPLFYIEQWFLWTFIACRLFLFFIRWDQAIGFDIGAHMEMFWNISKDNAFSFGVRDYFLSYHPPLSFLLAKELYLVSNWLPLGMISQLFSKGVAAVQAVSSLALLLQFFCIRALLKRAGVLFSVLGIAFLYFTNSIPLLIHMATSINLDALIFAFTSILVLVSGHLLWFPEEKTRLQKWLLAVLAVLCIVFAMLTKFSGLLLAAIPGLFVIAWVDRIPFRKWIKRLLAAIFLVALALAIVFPYYYYRYYKTEGSFFPTNTVWVIHDGHTNSLRRRNANPTEFIRTFFTPEVSFFFPKHENISTLRTHAAGIPRLSDTWEDFWIADISPIPQAWKSVLTSLQYLQIMPWLLIVGLVSVLGIAWRIDIWARMGVVFFMYGSVQLAALFRYVYQNPDAGFKPTKAIYIVSVVWLLGLIISAPSWFIDRIPSSRPAFKMAKFILGTAILICVVIFMTTNHILPVY